jgi:hypothetical protein
MKKQFASPTPTRLAGVLAALVRRRVGEKGAWHYFRGVFRKLLSYVNVRKELLTELVKSPIL